MQKLPKGKQVPNPLVLAMLQRSGAGKHADKRRRSRDREARKDMKDRD